MSTSPSLFLRRALVLDALSSGALGLLLVVAAAPLARMLALPAPLLFWAGASLLPFAAIVATVARRAHVPRSAVWAVIAYNALWALDSVLLLVLGWVSPGPLGVAFVLAQAAVVALFAEAQALGLRRTPVFA